MQVQSLFCFLLCVIYTLPKDSDGFAPGTPKTWSYEILSVQSIIDNPEKCDIDFTAERISRGVFGISGNFILNIDIAEGDSNTIEASSYHSSNGDEDTYRALPFKMPSQHMYEYLNGMYKDTLMDTLKDCSTFPAFENTFVPPMEKRTYTMEKCQFSQDGFPNHLQEGFYKVIMTGKGELGFKVIVICKVEKNT